VRTTRALILKLLQRGEYLGVRERDYEKNAFKLVAKNYNEDVVKPENQRITKMQGEIRKAKNFYKNKRESITFDLTNFTPKLSEEFVKALMKVKGRPLIEINNKTYTLTDRTIQSIIAIMGGVTEGEETESDGVITNHIIEGGTFRLLKAKESTGVNGSFYPYYSDVEGVDSSMLGIVHNKEEAVEKNIYKHNCILHALEQSGKLDEVTMQKLYLSVQTREMPQRKIEEIARTANIHIEVRRPDSNNHLRHYGDKSLPPIKLGLINEHYFLITQVMVTSYGLKNYHEVKHITEWWKIEKKKGTRYEKSNKRFIDSYAFVQLINEHNLQRKMPVNDVLNTPYFEKIREITTLDYDKKQVFLEEYKPKKREGTENYFFDFETTTDGDKHIAYLCRFVTKGQQKEFIGNNCGKQMLLYLCAKHFPQKNSDGTYEKTQKLNLYAHNAKYDFRFLFEYLNNVKSIGPKGTMLHASGDFSYQGVTFKISIQDTYAHIPQGLSAFGSMFKLDVSKEILPYDLYTKENVERRYIPISECLDYVKIQYEKNNIGVKIDVKKKKDFLNAYLVNCKKWGCIEKNLVDIIKYSSKYCEMDCDVLQKGYTKFRDWLLDITDLDVDCYPSISSLVQAYYQSKGVYDDVYKLAGNVREFIQKCMVGGRTMLSENKKSRFGYDKKRKFLMDFDAVSLYPSSMSRLKGYLRGKPKVLQNLTYKFLKKQTGYFVEILVKSVGTHRKFPSMSTVNIDGVRVFTNDMVGKHLHVDKASLEDLIEFQNIEFDVIRGYYFDEGRNEKLKECIDYLFAERVKQKRAGNPIEKVFKLMMNSSYGKTLLKPIDSENVYVPAGKVDRYIANNYNRIKHVTKVSERASIVKIIKPTCEHSNYAQCGVEVLSMSKRIMSEVMYLAEDNGMEIYYQDTDSMHIAEDDINHLAEAFEEKYGRKLIGSGMGQFHGDFDSNIIKGDIKARRSIFLGKKCYVDELVGLNADGKEAIDFHIRLKGVPNASILHKAQELRCSVMKIFERLYDGEEIEFDLLCGGKKVSFAFNATMTVSSRERFTRKIKF
jgi:hypothetical protein